MSSLHRALATPDPLTVPQTQPDPTRPEMVPNAAGGYAFQLDDFKRLRRFLILGTEGGTYYVGEKDLTKQNLELVERCVAAEAGTVAMMLRDITATNAAPKKSPALYVLAALSASKSLTREAWDGTFAQVVNTASHLFEWMSYVNLLRGWGRRPKSSIAAWYRKRDAQGLEYQMVKYRERNGFSHRDALRLGHVKPADDAVSTLFRWAVGKGAPETAGALPLITLYETWKAQAEPTVADLDAIRAYKVPRELLPAGWLNRPDVWRALLPEMPYTALIRNLGNLTKHGVIAPLAAGDVVARLSSAEGIKKAKVHPFSIFLAHQVYATGRGVRGGGEWKPVAPVVGALEAAFEAAMGNVAPTGKRFAVAIDVSGSMNEMTQGTPGVSCRAAAVAMAYTLIKTEPNTYPMAFSDGPDAWPLALHQRSSMSDAVRAVMGLSGGTNLSLPICHLLNRNLSVDVLVVFTDNESWAGRGQPHAWVQRYRKEVNPDLRVVVCAMSATHTTMGDIEDPKTFEAVGLDATLPEVIRFAATEG